MQIAKSFGASITGVSSTKNVELIRSLGAGRVIDYTQADFTEAGEGYDLILDNVGNRTLSALRGILSPNGKCVMAGAPKTLWAVFTRLLESIGAVAVREAEFHILHRETKLRRPEDFYPDLSKPENNPRDRPTLATG